MERSLLIHGSLAAVAVVAAAVAWLAPPAGDSSQDITVVAGTPERLESVRWHEDRYDVTVARHGEAGTEGNRTGIRVTVAQKGIKSLPKKQEAAERPGGEDGSTSDPSGESDGAEDPSEAAPQADPTPSEQVAAAEATLPPPVPKTYPGTTRAEKLFEELMPLKAARSLGPVADDRLADFGLADDPDRLVLRVGGQDRTLWIGQGTYGSGDRYAKLENSDEVFLLRAVTLSALRGGGPALADKRVLAVAPKDVRQVTIIAGDQRRELIQRYGEDRSKAFYADPAVPDSKLAKASAWIDRVIKLRLADVGADEPGGAVADLVIELYGNGKERLGTARFFKRSTPTSVAQSSFFDGPVSVTRANIDSVLRELPTILEEGK